MKNIFKIALLTMFVTTAFSNAAPATFKKNVMPVTITPVTGFELITLAEAKMHLRVDESFIVEDSKIQECIDGAISWAETTLDRGPLFDAVVVQEQADVTPMLLQDDWRLKSALASVKVRYFGDSEYSDLPLVNYTFSPFVDCNGKHFTYVNFLILEDFPAFSLLRVEYPLTLPKSIKSACLLVVADLYEYREDRGDVNSRRAYNLIKNYRKY